MDTQPDQQSDQQTDQKSSTEEFDPSDAEAQQFKEKRRRLWVVLTVCALSLIGGLVYWVVDDWFDDAETGIVAQRRFDEEFFRHEWDGSAGTWHYDNRVEVLSADIGDTEIDLLVPIFKNIDWLKNLSLDCPNISDARLKRLRQQLAGVTITTNER